MLRKKLPPADVASCGCRKAVDVLGGKIEAGRAILRSTIEHSKAFGKRQAGREPSRKPYLIDSIACCTKAWFMGFLRQGLFDKYLCFALVKRNVTFVKKIRFVFYLKKDFFGGLHKVMMEFCFL